MYAMKKYAWTSTFLQPPKKNHTSVAFFHEVLKLPLKNIFLILFFQISMKETQNYHQLNS